MLLQLGVNDSLAKCHSIANNRGIPGSPILWEEEKGCYELVAAGHHNYQAKVCALMMFLGSGFYGLNAAAALKSGELGMSCLTGLYAFGMGVSGATTLSFRRNAPDAASFLNGLLRLAERLEQDGAIRGTVRPNLVVTLLSRMLIAFQTVNPWLFSTVALLWPCSPLNMFSWVSGWCGPGGSDVPWWVVKVVAGLASGAAHGLFWKGAISQSIMNASHIFIGCLCQKSLLQVLARQLKQTNDNDDDDANKYANNNPFDLNMYYKSYQLLNTRFSNYSSSLCFGMFNLVIGAEIAITYLALKILDGSTACPLLIQLLLLGLWATALLFHLVAAGEAASVHILSGQVLTAAARKTSKFQKGKLSRRLIRSAWPLKVQFGECNYFEATTNLIMLDFTLRRVADLLLIRKK